MKRRVCIAQINYRSQNIHKHVERIKELIWQKRSADLIVFPELILHGHPSVEKPEGFLFRKMKIVYGSISADLHRFIKSIGAKVIIGEIKRRGDALYNVATYVDREVTASYTKTHVHWTENFVPGKRLVLFNTALGKTGINICFDAAFPEVWRVLALRGACVCVNVSAVPRSFDVKYMWRRMRGAALNNEVFVIYANRPGDHFAGHSAIFNPQGDLVASASLGEAVLETEIDLAEVGRWRHREPLFPHRRALLYREIVKQSQREPDLPVVVRQSGK